MIIQITLVLLAIVFAIHALSRRNTYSGKAWKKIGLILLVVLMIGVIIFPETINTIAHLVGVGRGADLLLYLFIVGFIFYALNAYLHQQDQRDKMYKLARKIAILEASEKYQSNSNK